MSHLINNVIRLGLQKSETEQKGIRPDILKQCIQWYYVCKNVMEARKHLQQSHKAYCKTVISSIVSSFVGNLHPGWYDCHMVLFPLSKHPPEHFCPVWFMERMVGAFPVCSIRAVHKVRVTTLKVHAWAAADMVNLQKALCRQMKLMRQPLWETVS